MLRKIQLYAHTLPTLKLKQIFYRIKYRVLPLKATQLQQSVTEHPQTLRWSFEQPFFLPQSLFSGNKVRFLNESGQVTSAQDWNHANKEKLWLYNLHYFDDLNAVDNGSRMTQQLALINMWIDQNPPVQGNGWEPYTLSLRIVNWIKWYQRHHIDNTKILHSLMLQCQALERQLEHHILGNHLFANGKALVFAGAMFEGDLGAKYMSLGLRILDAEVAEQFLHDGGHFELSPMYHSILLWDMIDLYNIAQRSGHKALAERKADWRKVIENGLGWLSAMCHPDGEISFFNDAAFGIAASPSVLFDYARLVGIDINQVSKKLCVNSGSVTALTLHESGYTRLESPKALVLFDHAEVGPSYLPGHAHADTLSIEVSVDGQRVFVNSGTSIYGNGPERHRQRGTPAHNTLSLCRREHKNAATGLDIELAERLENSSEVWGGFRVARRARVNGLSVRQGEQVGHNGQCVAIKASHDGFTRFVGGLVHERQCVLCNDHLTVIDRLHISGVKGKLGKQTLPKGCCGVVHFHLAPGIEVVDSEGTDPVDDRLLSAVSLRLPNQRVVEFSASGHIEAIASTWHPEFGASVANIVLRVYVGDGALECKLKF